MSQKKIMKAANSKGKLVKAVVLYQHALAHYANENHWAVKGDDIVWLGDDDPTYAAAVTLGQRKPDSNYGKKDVREPDKNPTPPSTAPNAGRFPGGYPG